MKAFSQQATKHTLGKDRKLMQAEKQPPSSNAAYKLALIMYNYALRYKIQDNLEWRYERRNSNMKIYTNDLYLLIILDAIIWQANVQRKSEDHQE